MCCGCRGVHAQEPETGDWLNLRAIDVEGVGGGGGGGGLPEVSDELFWLLGVNREFVRGISKGAGPPPCRLPHHYC